MDEELQIGQILWRVSYYNWRYAKSQRVIEKRKIIKINKKTVKISYYNKFFVRKDEVNNRIWFTTKSLAIKNAILLHEAIKNKHDLVIKEIKSLKKLLKKTEVKIIQDV